MRWTFLDMKSERMSTQSMACGLNGVSGALAWADAAKEAGAEDEPALLLLSMAGPARESTLRLSSVT